MSQEDRVFPLLAGSSDMIVEVTILINTDPVGNRMLCSFLTPHGGPDCYEVLFLWDPPQSAQTIPRGIIKNLRGGGATIR